MKSINLSLRSLISNAFQSNLLATSLNVKHWHGAAADGYFSHLAIGVAGENQSNEWLEPVTDEEYDKLK